MSTAKRLNLSWEEFHRDTQELARQLQDKGPWHKIIAVTRGGLVPTAILVQYLDVRLIDTVCIASYSEDDKQKQAEVFKTITDENQHILVIDDLVDTGKTFTILRQTLPHATYASVYYKAQGQHLVNFTVKQIPQDVWVVFPWEEA